MRSGAVTLCVTCSSGAGVDDFDRVLVVVQPLQLVIPLYHRFGSVSGGGRWLEPQKNEGDACDNSRRDETEDELPCLEAGISGNCMVRRSALMRGLKWVPDPYDTTFR